MSLFDELLEEQKENRRQTQSMMGIVYGVVKENWDQDHPGMVKVEILHGESGKNVSDWIPVMSPYAGKEFGAYALPEIGTQAVVAFEMGNLHSPVVIGCLWNQKDPVPPKAANEKNTEKTFVTKGGTRILISDEGGKEKIEIETKGKLFIGLDDEKQMVAIRDEKADNSISMDCKNGAMVLEAKEKLTLRVNKKDVIALDGKAGSATVKTKQVTVEAEQALKLKGQSGSLEGNSLSVKGQTTKLEGNMLDLAGKGTLKAESNGMLQLKGSMVKIN